MHFCTLYWLFGFRFTLAFGTDRFALWFAVVRVRVIHLYIEFDLRDWYLGLAFRDRRRRAAQFPGACTKLIARLAFEILAKEV